ncbi:MAG: nicotinate-nucleotide--dimethylbenzimidazole phosphoribosyltransferase [Burkholderiales bacterium]|jgi:nicotinate-nucleotide--dimethylbenzimidazole phosphoribosyltransferase|nr:nicotinate-nucleotide--dimethylbenzimidazole phosphoribosyltransferase [Burkholderiales bacterium]
MLQSLDWLFHKTQAPNHGAAQLALHRQSILTKPSGSLGRLESLVVQLAGHQGNPVPAIHAPHISIFAADHGVAALGVSAYPQSVTAQMLANFSAGGAAICVLAKQHAAALSVVDVGVLGGNEALAGVRRSKVAQGTSCFTECPAMSETQLSAALSVGFEAVQAAKAQGCDLFIAGEMGIGNTTSASALACAVLGSHPRQLVGRGTGVNLAAYQRKISLIAQALSHHQTVVAGKNPTDILAALGGFEIAAITGAAIACAQAGITFLVDGFIATVATLLAVKINPAVRHWCVFAHQSAEYGHQAVMAALHAKPLMQLDMRLGEGSGAALALPLIRAACDLHANMATFAEAGVSNKGESV